MRKGLICLMIGVILTGCATYQRNPEKWRSKIMDLQIGMSEYEVLEKLGEPSEVIPSSDDSSSKLWCYSSKKIPSGGEMVGVSTTIWNMTFHSFSSNRPIPLGTFILYLKNDNLTDINKLKKAVFSRPSGRMEIIPLLPNKTNEAKANKAIELVKNSHGNLIQEKTEQIKRYYSKTCGILIIGWEARLVSNEIYLVSYTLKRVNRINGWYFEVDLSKPIIKNIANDKHLMLKYSISSKDFLERN